MQTGNLKQRARLINIALCALAGILVFGVIQGSETEKAQALTALTITDKSTFSSLNSGSWQRVYRNDTSGDTRFVDTSGASFKMVKVNSTGSTTATVTAALVGGSTTVTSETGSSTKTDTLYSQALGGTTQALLTGGITTVGEKIGSASSLLVGQVVNSCTVSLKKTGAPAGTAIIAIMNAAGTTQYQCGTQDVSLLTVAFQTLTYTGSAAPYTIANGDIIGVFFNGGSAGNTLDVQYENADVFDGTTNSIQQDCTGLQGALVCTNRTTRELMLNLAYVYQASYANDGVLTTYWENGAFVVRAVQSDFDGVKNLRSGSLVAACEHVTATSALIGASVDEIRVLLAKTGSPTGTITAGVYNSALALQYTFNTMAAASLTATATSYTFTSATDRTLASGDYVCITFAGGSVGNTVDVSFVSLNPYDGTNSVVTTFTGTTPTDTAAADLRFRLIDNPTNDQESGAFLKWNAGSALATGGVKVYWFDNTKIPSSVKLSTSTDDITYTDRVTLSPIIAAGYNWLSFDASYTVQYVKLTVVTWGSANSMAIAEMQRLPSDIASVSISAVENSGTNYFVYYVGSVTTNLYAGKINLDTGQVTNSITTAAGTTVNSIGTKELSATDNKIYYGWDSSNTAFNIASWNRDLTSASTSVVSVGVDPSQTSSACVTSIDGASAATDIVYCSVNIGTQFNIYKYLNGALSLLGNVPCTNCNAVGANVLADTSAKIILKIITNSATGTVATYTITKSGDTLSAALYSTVWLTLPDQQFNFDGSTARTYRSVGEVYFATSTYAIKYAASTSTLTDPDVLYIETVNSGTGVMAGFDDTVFYRLSNTMIISGSGTVWTPRTFSGYAISPVPYTELLNVPLQQNYTIFNQQGILKINCDNVYPLLKARTHYIQTDSDCATWLVVPTSTDTIGRLLDYSRTATLVHANPMTAYTIQLSASSPDLYSIETQYLTTPVDSGAFDSGGALNQYLLYGNCYTMQIIEESTGNTLQTGSLCANGVTTKTISLSGITIPSDWQSATWSHIISRNFTNPTNNGITFTFAKSTTPYNGSLYVYNNALETPTFTQWYNFTNVSGTSIANITGQNSNQTLYFELYENNVLVVQDTSNPESLSFDPFPSSVFGEIFGLPLAAIFPVITAAIFPKSLAYFGSIVTLAVIGIISIFGLYSPPVWFWAMIMPVVAVSVFAGYKRT